MSGAARVTAAVFAVALAACRERPPQLDSCADPLGGVWRDPAGRGFHILDRGREVDVFPMWDTTAPDHGFPGARTPKPRIGADPPSAPVRSPVRILLRERTRERVDGAYSVRIDRCAVQTHASIHGCYGRNAVLTIEDEPTVNLLTCATTPSVDRIDVPLRRE